MTHTARGPDTTAKLWIILDSSDMFIYEILEFFLTI